MTVSGPGYRFETPHDVEREGRTIRARGAGFDVSVTTFRLRRLFRPAAWSEVLPELDRVAASLGERLGARSRASTTTVAGRRARVYDFDGASDGTRRVAFVLYLRREYQLLCRWEEEEAETGSEACAELFASFRLF